MSKKTDSVKLTLAEKELLCQLLMRAFLEHTDNRKKETDEYSNRLVALYGKLFVYKEPK